MKTILLSLALILQANNSAKPIEIPIQMRVYVENSQMKIQLLQKDYLSLIKDLKIALKVPDSWVFNETLMRFEKPVENKK